MKQLSLSIDVWLSIDQGSIHFLIILWKNKLRLLIPDLYLPTCGKEARHSHLYRFESPSGLISMRSSVVMQNTKLSGLFAKDDLLHCVIFQINLSPKIPFKFLYI